MIQVGLPHRVTSNGDVFSKFLLLYLCQVLSFEFDFIDGNK